MSVFADRVDGCLAADAACQDDGDLTFQIDHFFQYARGIAKLFKGAACFSQCIDLYLALAVVAHGGGLHQQRRIQRLDGSDDVGIFIDGGKGGSGKTMILYEGLFTDAVLCNAHSFGIRAYGTEFFQILHALGRDVFEFGRNGRTLVTQHL